jgi:hypothetical protein
VFEGFWDFPSQEDGDSFYGQFVSVFLMHVKNHFGWCLNSVSQTPRRLVFVTLSPNWPLDRYEPLRVGSKHKLRGFATYVVLHCDVAMSTNPARVANNAY